MLMLMLMLKVRCFAVTNQILINSSMIFFADYLQNAPNKCPFNKSIFILKFPIGPLGSVKLASANPPTSLI